ncbi:tripartite ATP-independent transporter DctP family solute receptor [Virgibacillus natechei]|uniref:Tripartite ATP-independent transporter DctP family solute receptor n=1 Tax=Virgibacillus natechei TaxID=1216297 RepID=A0ABS4IL90_9BACI|nr:TRAP transporter substrate-binding protein [Virgibacillus natechei]MBP1971712.1 tripartite ATP-independent transporter DctP family solute receptor [Virgibacillus natechei]UZD12151.1 TRAP transporter substrate-binding protein [Virgibacillus natechei]
MPQRILLAAIFSLFLFLSACGGYSNPNIETTSEAAGNPVAANVSQDPQIREDGDVITLRLGHQTPESTNYHTASLRFKELVAEKTDGKVQIEIYPFRQLGTDRELLEAMQFGTLDLGMITGPAVSGFAPETSVLDLPYLFDGWDHVNEFIGTETEDKYRAITEEVNLKTFGLMARGFRHVSTSTGPIESLDDFNGLTVRVSESPIYIEAYEALGASPQSMNFGDAYTALEQGAIDGQENTMDINDDENINDVNSHVSKTGINFAFAFLMGSKDRFESLPEDAQVAILEASEEVLTEINKENEENEAEYENVLEEKGMEINELDLDLFKEKVEGIYQNWTDQHGTDLLSEILGMTE